MLRKQGLGWWQQRKNIQRSSRDTAAAKARGAGDHNSVKNARNEVSEMSVQVTKEKNNIMICEMKRKQMSTGVSGME